MSSENRGGGRILELDGIRGLAVASVIVWHYVGCTVEAAPGTALGRAITALGLTWGGVDVFFVLSGFLIGGILLEKQDSAQFFRTFYMRRICRIMPPYFFLLGICLALWWFAGKTKDAPFAWMFHPSLPWPAYPLFLQNFLMATEGHCGPQPLGVTWSLAIEEQFYLITPLLAWLWRPRALAWVLVAAVIIAIVYRIHVFLTWHNGGHAAYVLLPCRWDALSIGFLVAIVMRSPARRAALATPGAIRSLWVSLSLCALIACILGAKMQRIASPGMSFGGYTVLALGAACLLCLALVSKEDSLVRRALRTRVLLWLGGISYMAYLVHELFLGIIHTLVRHQAPRIVDGVDVGLTLASLMLTLIFATLSWRIFESPIVRYGHRFKY